jgi:hypothetical protein
LQQKSTLENAWIPDTAPPNQMTVEISSSGPTVACYLLTQLISQLSFLVEIIVQTPQTRNAALGKIVGLRN